MKQKNEAVPPSKLGELLGFRLSRLSGKFARLADRDAQQLAGLSLPEYRVLVLLDALKGAGVIALQDAMSIDKAWVSRTLGKLLARKLVRQQPDTTDGRRISYQVTDAGRQVADRLFRQAVIRHGKFYEGFSAEEQETLISLLDRVEANVLAASPPEKTA